MESGVIIRIQLRLRHAVHTIPLKFNLITDKDSALRGYPLLLNSILSRYLILFSSNSKHTFI